MLAIFLDTEASGLDPFFHRLLEIAFKIVDVSTGVEKFSYQAIIKQPLEIWEQRDLKSIEINGFTWEKCETGKEEAVIRQEIIDIFTQYKITRGTAVYICQNPAFDRSFFSQLIDVYTQEKQNWPYHWLDFASMYWALRIKSYQDQDADFPLEINVSKNAIAQNYQLPLESIPHSALQGVKHLLLCYQKVVGFKKRGDV